MNRTTNLEQGTGTNRVRLVQGRGRTITVAHGIPYATLPVGDMSFRVFVKMTYLFPMMR